ncbi:RluA family pseudouridine synthase [Flagellimonas pacifica]|uniref:Ribosomal large subunit pseudouridine synthase D n=1 Tax=Flagellimonas pacifica TaxID=1247520 RepID=A0A285MW02_9FLAO|nr:RluA family pseudouridine synthase [Allomuricauda parva]SNZ00717.1 ribosomal large subunit pseudouridine synthase D [Allomuricauda parva]
MKSNHSKNPKTQKSSPSNLDVLYEDNHVIVVNKRSGDIVQGDKTGDIPLSEVVKQYLKKKHNKPGNVYLGVVHRLDRPTSGIVVFAKTSKALPRLNKLFSEGKTKKVYWAVVNKAPEHDSGILTHWLVRNPKQNKSYAHKNEVPNSKKAILEYRVRKKLDRYFLLEIDLKTGRHHQIRAQLAAMSAYIKGDLKYGADRSNKDGGIHLLARSLEFEHPVKKEKIRFEVSPPNDPVWNACI